MFEVFDISYTVFDISDTLRIREGRGRTENGILEE
jgi:hypothetical protein